MYVFCECVYKGGSWLARGKRPDGRCSPESVYVSCMCVCILWVCTESMCFVSVFLHFQQVNAKVGLRLTRGEGLDGTGREKMRAPKGGSETRRSQRKTKNKMGGGWVFWQDGKAR